jgi:hypothetical protein
MRKHRTSLQLWVLQKVLPEALLRDKVSFLVTSLCWTTSARLGRIVTAIGTGRIVVFRAETAIDAYTAQVVVACGGRRRAMGGDINEAKGYSHMLCSSLRKEFQAFYFSAAC